MIIKNASVFINGEFKKNDISVNNGIIDAVGYFDCTDGIDMSDMYIIPGLVDIHTHGCAGYDFSSADEKQIKSMRNYYLRNGITAILATTVALSDDNIRKACNKIKKSAINSEGASIAGINLEGPYLSPNKCGAHDIALLKEPDIDFINSLGDDIKVVHVAPEYSKASDFIKQFKGKVSIAHTACDYETAMKAISNGADHITHIFNAMNPLHHRNPGVIGAFFDSEAVAEMICDSIHIDPAILRMMFKAYSDRIAVISDSMAATGLDDGIYKLGDLDVYVNNSVATLSDGTLAGSAMNLFDMMKNLITIGIEPEKAIKSVTEIPADSVGIGNMHGHIAVGRNADLVMLNKDFTLNKIMFKGQFVLDINC